MNFEELTSYLKERDLTMSRYEREDWDYFVRKSGLSLDVPFIHITGSNGKGSVANYIYNIYRKAGYKVAIFSKPYFYKPNEMMVADDEMISDEDFLRIFNEEEKLIGKSNLSSFEIQTYIAFKYFNEKKPDLAIIECGMGGETDSTNLPSSIPELSIITSVSLEHTMFLGRTLSEIAENKGGIIKKNSSLLIGKIEDEAKVVLQDICRRKNAHYFELHDYYHEELKDDGISFDYGGLVGLKVKSKAFYMVKDASMAIEAIKILGNKFPVEEKAVFDGVYSDPLPGRMEIHGNVIFDGAHNPEAIDYLMDSIVKIKGDKPVHVLFASYQDKNIAVELPRIGRDVDDITLTTFDSNRARGEDDYFLYLGDFAYINDPEEALKGLMEKYPDDWILVTGSLSFISKLRLIFVK